MTARDKIKKSLAAWAPNWPRRVTQHQQTANNAATAASMLLNAERGEPEPFISTYAFPRGHTKGNHIPKVDTLFIDFDFEDGEYDGDGDVDAWRRDLSRLLVRTRTVAEFLLKQGATHSWRASLSGHKGVHLFHDFEPLDPDLGEFAQYVQGMNDYATKLVEDLSDGTGLPSLHDYVDVTSSDLGRLCRAPHTQHGGATKAFGEPRFCVPVTIEQLAEIGPDEYLELTRTRGEPVHDGRTTRQDTAIIEQHIRSANPHTRRTRSAPNTVDWSRINEYKKHSNDELTMEDVRFILHDRPCMWEWKLREDKFDYGYQSHYMEIAVITELVHYDVPIELIKQVLQPSEKYDEQQSEQQIRAVIAYNYNRFAPASLIENSPEFTHPESCQTCRRGLEQLHGSDR